MAALRAGKYLLLERLADAESSGEAAFWRALWRQAGQEREVIVERRSTLPAPERLVPRDLDFGHINLAQLLETEMVDGVWWIVTELIEAMNLADLMRASAASGVRLAPAAAAWIVAEAARGVAYLHSRQRRNGHGSIGLLHGRISPGLVLIGATGGVALAGLILRPRGSLPSPPVGAASSGRRAPQTPFTAPEQTSGEPLDGRCDVYALGALLRELLGSTDSDGNCDDPELHLRLVGIAHRATAVSRAVRLSSAAELRQELLEQLLPYPFGKSELAAVVRRLLPYRPEADELPDGLCDEASFPRLLSPPPPPNPARIEIDSSVSVAASQSPLHTATDATNGSLAIEEKTAPVVTGIASLPSSRRGLRVEIRGVAIAAALMTVAIVALLGGPKFHEERSVARPSVIVGASAPVGAASGMRPWMESPLREGLLSVEKDIAARAVGLIARMDDSAATAPVTRRGDRQEDSIKGIPDAGLRYAAEGK